MDIVQENIPLIEPRKKKKVTFDMDADVIPSKRVRAPKPVIDRTP